MRGILRPKRRRMWVPAMTAVVIMGAGVVWTASGADGAKLGRMRTVPTNTVQLQIDEAYYEAVGPRLPGEIVGAPIQEDLEAVPVGGPRGKPGLVSVLVYMEEGTIASAIERADVRAFAAQRGGVVKYEYNAVLPNVLNLRDIPESQVDALKELPGVVRIEEDEYHQNVLMLHDSMPLIRGLQSQITGAGYSADGAGVRICIVDTGIDSDHIMYSDRIDTSKGYDFYNDDSNPEDDHGHGSHCSGIAAGGTGLSWDPCGTGSMPFQGVAPEATLIGVKVLNSAGGGYDSDIIAGINYCADQSASGAQADVISMSIGTGNYSGPCTHSWAVAANNAVANGVVAVAASGNENYSNALSSPACGASVIAVGMTWKNDYPTCEDPTTNWNWGICTDYAPQTDEVGCFSNESDYLDVTAPGANIWSASNAAGGGSITGMSGTSMSCPTVAGLTALILSADGSLTPAEVRQIIRDGAIDMGSAGFDRAYGYGRIDVLNSLALVEPEPECEYDWECDDVNLCTDDACVGGFCEYTNNTDSCDDGLFCNGADTCSGGNCSVHAGDPCVGGSECADSCNESADNCYDPAGTVCTDDGNVCTDNECDGGGSCVAYDNTDSCDDGLFCNGADTCSGGTCSVHAGDPCVGGSECADNCNEAADNCFDPAGTPCTDDGNVCTDDECDGAGTCGIPNTDPCDDGLFCTLTDNCSGGVCVGTGDPCEPGQYCNEDTDICEDVECIDNEDCDDNNACTVDICTDGVCYNECASTVSSYPYTEGFESGWGDWINASGDDMDWTRDSAGTPSSSTGPSSAHGGTYYVYTESSSPNYPDKTAILEGPCFDLANTSDAELSFWYHMYGSAMGTLNVEVSEDCVTWTNMWSLSGDQGNSWYEANVNLTSYSGTTIVIRFRGITGSSYRSDMAVDDISVTVTPAIPCDGDEDCDDGLFCTGVETCVDYLCQPGSDPCPGQACNEETDTCEEVECINDEDCDDDNACTVDTCTDGVCYNECASTVSSYPYTEGFESGWGDWVNASGDDFDWTRRSGSTPSSSTGPSGAHGGSYYVYTESSSPNYPNKTAILEGPCFDLTSASDAELTFWYHMYGSNMGTLNVEVSEDCVSWTNAWSLSGDQGNSWYEANVDLTSYSGTTIVIRFRGVTGSSYRSDMAVDDISVTATVGPMCDYDWECDDGVYCNGEETCVDHVCQDGTAVDCDDGVGCTDDSCNEGTDSCDNVANDANCDNGLYCDGAEWCDSVSDCQDGTAIDCYDGVDCTGDSCNEGTDSCDNIPNDAYCDNGVYCDGAETCDPVYDCQPGTAVDCDDGVGCTDDSCNEGTDSCDNIPNDAYCPDDGLFCNGTEFCDAVADCSSTGDPCEPGETCNEDTDACDPGGAGIMEAGTVTVGGTAVTVNLTSTYVNPVVVCSVQYYNNSTPVVARVTAVTSTSFDVYLQNPSGSGVSSETVSYLVVEEGTWTIDGVDIEAQKYLSTVTDENNSWVGESQSYGQSYTSPVVLGQVMSDNDPMWSVFWCQGSRRTNPPSASALKTGKEVAEDTDTTRADETVGFIVFEAGHGTIGGVEFEALVGADTVAGVTNSPPYTYTFDTSFTSAPTVAVTTMAGMDGGNGGWSYSYGANPTTSTTLNLACDEDQIGDSERNHTTEQVGYVVFESAVVFP